MPGKPRKSSAAAVLRMTGSSLDARLRAPEGAAVRGDARGDARASAGAGDGGGPADIAAAPAGDGAAPAASGPTTGAAKPSAPAALARPMTARSTRAAATGAARAIGFAKREPITRATRRDSAPAIRGLGELIAPRLRPPNRAAGRAREGAVASVCRPSPGGDRPAPTPGPAACRSPGSRRA